MSIRDGANFAPKGKPAPVCGPKDFCFAAAFLDHGHVYGQTNGLIEAGGTLMAVYDPVPERAAAFAEAYGNVPQVSSFDALLEWDELKLITAAAVPNRRGPIGEQVMRAGKHYFTDKSPFTSLEQLESARRVSRETNRRYFVYYAERVHNEAAWQAGELIADGAVGRVLQVATLAPHRLGKSSRPDWFFEKDAYGGIITDIGSHQVEQFLTYAGCEDASLNFARATNFSHPDKPGLEDFGEWSMTGDNGASFYARVDWYTPDGMPVWGDGRTFILGSEGSLEVRKYVDLGRAAPASLILHVDGEGVHQIDCQDRVGYPFFGQLIKDVLDGSDTAMSQEHTFKAAELSMQAQLLADQSSSSGATA